MHDRRFSGAVILAASFLPTVSFAQASVHDFELGGSASVLNEECIRLTPDAPYVSGSAWFKKSIDLTRPFEMRMSLVLGKKDRQGADGIVFVFHPVPGTGLGGEGMGFAGLVPSLGIEFDTYRNLHLNDPEADHLAVMVDGRRYHGEDGVGFVEVRNLEDGGRHPLRIYWDPEGSELTIFLDGKKKATFRSDLVKSIFGGRSRVYWGMTAATGRLSNDQDVCIEKMFLARGHSFGPSPGPGFRSSRSAI